MPPLLITLRNIAHTDMSFFRFISMPPRHDVVAAAATLLRDDSALRHDAMLPPFSRFQMPPFATPCLRDRLMPLLCADAAADADAATPSLDCLRFSFRCLCLRRLVGHFRCFHVTPAFATFA